ncbi:4'-phosphopantetheinyl transferase family protein [Phytohabitans rumicis]|uniref:4'-phosphopantetheinyl transferase n=1 Tax=Phytohabitans rumicis TaxID=1076125 RepID=A0A6V8L4B4_9ACTN|nr:4'-phosphopantetheinyl transferase superfamily protein [Phytohabitans rumicis]GFJ92102.1 4'-phosphopantetheinyl transferase [Phytohabitans rumicis]
MLRELLPPVVSAVEAYDDEAPVELFPEELAVIARSVDKRRREFTTVRRCAREALARLGYAPAPIVPGERGAPGWPAGVVGSMTHCEGYRACAVAHRDDVLTLGLDAEPDAPLPEGVLGVISLPAEREMIQRLGGSVHWDRLLFCAKEAVYKAWFPLTRSWLDFSEARVSLDPAGTFHAELLVPAPLPSFDGRWLARDGLLLSAIAVPSS